MYSRVSVCVSVWCAPPPPPNLAEGPLAHLTAGFYHLLLLQTSVNVFGKQFVAYYSRSRWTAIYFVLFIIIGNLLVLKMVIAVGYNSYRSYMRAKVQKHVAMRNQALVVAYKLLADGDGISLECWMRLCKQLQRPDELVGLPPSLSLAPVGRCSCVWMLWTSVLCVSL